MRRSSVRLALALSLVAALAGCAGRGGPKKGADSNRYIARDVDTLYNAAKDRLDKHDYRTAAILFDEVERQHPYSPWARRAELMSSFSYYLAHSYPESIQSAQRFLSIHPGNKDAPYAMYLDRGGLLRTDHRRHARPEDHPAGAGRDGRPDPPLSGQHLCRRRAAQDGPHQRPSRRQGDGDRPLLPAPARLARLHLSASARWWTITRAPATSPRR